MKKLPVVWLAAAFIITVIFGTIYGSIQQVLRQGANDPQIQLAEDAATQITFGNTPDTSKWPTVNIASSLAPFIVIYDIQGNPTAGSGQLDGHLPSIPKGVLTHADPENKITWQPKDGVRIAAISHAAGNSYVVVGRNLREVENRESQVFLLSAVGWGISEVALLAAFALKRTVKNTK